MDRTKVKEKAGLMFEMVKEKAGITLRRGPWGNAQGNTVDFGFAAEDMAWLVCHLGEWAREYAPEDAARLVVLFERGDVLMPKPIATQGPAIDAIMTSPPVQGPPAAVPHGG